MERQIPICRRERKENVVDSILCKGSNKCLFYNALRHTIQSTTKNKSCEASHQRKRISSDAWKILHR